MATKVNFINRGNRPQSPGEFEQQRGDRAPRVITQPAPFALAVPPKRSVVGSMPARPAGGGVSLLRAFFNLTGAANATLILPQSAGVRNFVLIRNSSASAGSVFVGFGIPPTGVGSCDVELTSGAYLMLDIKVPQDDIWLFSDIGASGNVSYAINKRGRR